MLDSEKRPYLLTDIMTIHYTCQFDTENMQVTAIFVKVKLFAGSLSCGIIQFVVHIKLYLNNCLETFVIWAFKSHKYVLYFSALSECVQTGNSTNTRLTLQRLNLLLNKLDGAMFQCSLCFLLLYNLITDSLFQSFD